MTHSFNAMAVHGATQPSQQASDIQKHEHSTGCWRVCLLLRDGLRCHQASAAVIAAPLACGTARFIEALVLS